MEKREGRRDRVKSTGHEEGALEDCENDYEEGKTLDKSKRVDPRSRQSEVETRRDEFEGLRGESLKMGDFFFFFLLQWRARFVGAQHSAAPGARGVGWWMRDCKCLPGE